MAGHARRMVAPTSAFVFLGLKEATVKVSVSLRSLYKITKCQCHLGDHWVHLWLVRDLPTEANKPTKMASYFPLIFIAADHCAIGNPCKNGGTCLNGEKKFECHCLPGFYGVDCGGMCYFILIKKFRSPVDILRFLLYSVFMGRIVNACHIFSHQIWMFVTLVHVKILGLATILELGGLCACVLQISEESHVQVRAWDGKVDIIEYPWIPYGVFLLIREYNFAVLTPNQLGLIKGYWYSVSFVSSLCACPTEFLEEEKKKKMFSLISLFVYC